MRPKQEVIEGLLHPGLVAVVRALRADQVPPLAEALVRGGITAIEVTMSTPDTFQAIAATVKRLGRSGLVGVGTVLDAETAHRAIEAGAEFVVTPILRREVLNAAHQHDRPAMIGSYTPTECQLAHEMGADFVKLFPADGLGPSYIKSLRGPLPHLKIVPTGGVDLKNIGAFFKAGAVAVGLGSSLVSGDILKNDDWTALEALAREFIAATAQSRAT